MRSRSFIITAVLATALLGAGAVHALEYRLYMVYFDKGSTTLNRDAKPVIADAAGYYLKGFKGEPICLDSHTDTIGSKDDNLARSQTYGDVVAKALVAKGIPADRITIRSRGETDLFVETKDEIDEPLNRHVAIYYGDTAREYCDNIRD